MRILESREFYRLQAIVPVASVNLDNINIEFNGLSLYNEDEDEKIEITGRRTVVEKDRCSEGIKIDFYVLNEGDNIKDRIDYLVDEDYEIEDFYLKVSNKRNGKEMEFKLNRAIGEQVTKKVPVEVAPEIESATDYITSSITEGNEGLNEIIYKSISNNKELQKFINKVLELEI